MKIFIESANFVPIFVKSVISDILSMVDKLTIGTIISEVHTAFIHMP